jgi:hypothetical protein
MNGHKTGGRAKGVPNKLTADVRAVFAGIMERNAEKCEGWIAQVAATDPFKATDLLLRLAEFHVPKLARSEVTGKDGGPLIVQAQPADERL